MAYNVILTSGFKRELKHIAKKHRQILTDINLLIANLEVNPFTGSDLGKNVYKIRLKITGSSKGKSGGARIITYIKIVFNPYNLYNTYNPYTHPQMLKNVITIRINGV